MELLRAIILGAVQGVTEFLPISSDGHLVVVDLFLPGGSAGRDALGFDILLHCGSLFAVLIGFRDVWLKLTWRTGLLIVIGTVPGVLAGLFLQDIVAGELRTLTAAAIGFLITAACLIAGETIGRIRGERTRRTGVVDALLIGLSQAVAVLPGVSRSGLTVSMGRALGMPRSNALDFSFLLAIPIITGAVAKTGLDAFEGAVVFPVWHVSLAGFAVSAVVSLCAILFLRRFVRGYSFAWFAWYLIPLALLLLAEDAGFRTLLDAPHAQEAVRGFGSLAVFTFALVEVVPPFSFLSPGITALLIAGSLAPDPLSLLAFASAAVAASLIGNTVLYALGRFAGPSLVRALRLPEEAKRRGEEFVRTAGLWAVIGGQFIGALRPTVAFAAGMLGMHPAAFFSAAFTGALLWGGSAVGAGWLVRGNLALIGVIVVGVGAATLLLFMLALLVQWRRARVSK